MNPGEAERKLRSLEAEHEEVLRELSVYKEFFEASYAMNVAAASLPDAQRVREATTACVTEKTRARIGESELEKMKARVKKNS